MKYRLDVRKPPLIILILLISFPSVPAVLISPALPAISDFFNISNGYTQQLVNVFIFGYAFGQLVYSPFANRYGRKISLYIGISIYLASCLLCIAGIFMKNIEVIFVGRFFMALGSSVGMVITFTIINDFYFTEQARPIISYTVLAYAFMPALAILTGGFITSHLSWQSCFYFLLFYGIAILLCCMRLPETLTEKQHDALKIKPLVEAYKKAFKTKRLILFSAMYGLSAAFVYIIASGAPFIGIDTIGLSPAQYGMLILIPYCGQIIGALSSGRLSGRLSPYQLLLLGLSFVCIGSVLMLVSFLFGWIAIASFITPIMLIMIGLPMTYSSVTVMAMHGYEDKATGSAVMSFITMSTTLFFTLLLSVLPSRYPLVMPLLFVVVVSLSLLGYRLAKQRYSDQTDSN